MNHPNQCSDGSNLAREPLDSDVKAMVHEGDHFLFEDVEHPSNLQSSLWHMREEDAMCDVTIQVEDLTFTAHRCVLAAASVYFYTMFTSGFRERLDDKVILKGLTLDAWKQLLQYSYTGKLDIPSDAMLDVFEAADFLQYDNVKHILVQHLSDTTTDENCFSHALLAEKYNTETLATKAHRHISTFFSTFASNIDSLHMMACLPHKAIVSILSSDLLDCYSEISVLQVVLEWLAKHPNATDEERSSLIGTIRYGLLQEDSTINELWRNDKVLGFKNCKKISIQLVKYFHDDLRKPLHSGTFCRPRGPMCILIIGGKQTTDSCALANIMTSAILADGIATGVDNYIATDTIGNIYDAAALVVGNYLFVMGGCHREGLDPDISDKPVNTCVRYDSVRNAWLKLEPMGTARSGHACAVLFGSVIMVIGGKTNSSNKSAMVEEYRIDRNSWSTSKPFHYDIVHLAACNYRGQHDGHIYLSGGNPSGPDNPMALADIYKYNYVGDDWELKGHLLEARFSHSMCASSDKIFIIGGRNTGYRRLASVEVFDPETTQSTMMSSLPKPRCDIDVVLHGGFIWVAGGYEIHQAGTDTLYLYDIERDEWGSMSRPLPAPVMGASCALLTLPWVCLEPSSSCDENNL